MRKKLKLPPFLLLSLVIAGCASPNGSLRTYPISGGKVVQLPFAPGGALPTETAEIKIQVTGYLLDRNMSALAYCFAFTEKNNATPKKVVIEDVTAFTPVTLVVDENPALDPNGLWRGESTRRKAGDPSLDWVSIDGNTEKVFQFTITTRDDRILTLYQASVWSAGMKPVIRQILKM